MALQCTFQLTDNIYFIAAFKKKIEYMSLQCLLLWDATVDEDVLLYLTK